MLGAGDSVASHTTSMAAMLTEGFYILMGLTREQQEECVAVIPHPIRPYMGLPQVWLNPGSVNLFWETFIWSVDNCFGTGTRDTKSCLDVHGIP